jgi:hypothetical protein
MRGGTGPGQHLHAVWGDLAVSVDKHHNLGSHGSEVAKAGGEGKAFSRALGIISDHNIRPDSRREQGGLIHAVVRYNQELIAR